MTRPISTPPRRRGASGRRPLLLTLLLLASALWPGHAARAQEATQSDPPHAPAQTDAARFDQLINECRQLMSAGRFEQITGKAEEALALSRKAGDRARQARALTYVALGLFHTGRTAEAIEPFKQSAALAGEAGERRLQAVALNSAAALLQESGEYAQALDFYSQSLAVSREQKDRAGEATALKNIGGLYLITHDYTKASDVLRRSLELARGLGAARIEYGVNLKLGMLEVERRNFEAALRYAAENEKLEAQVKDSALKFQARNVAVSAHFNLGNLEKAAEAAAEMLEIARAQKVPHTEGQALALLALVQLKLGRSRDALASAARARVLFHQSKEKLTAQASVLYMHAQAQRALGRTDEALSEMRQAVALIERARPGFIPTEEAKAQFVARNSNVFIGLIDLLSELKRHAEALAVAESYHARAFLELLAESRADLRGVLPKELLEQEEEILGRISEVQRQLWQEGISTEREQALKSELAGAEASLDLFRVRVRRENPRYADLKHFDSYGAERVQRELLDPGTAMIEYVLGPERSYAWLVSKKELAYAVLPPEKELGRLVADYRKAIAEKSSVPAAHGPGAGLAGQGRNLYRILIQPFEPQLAGLRRLIIVPDNALAYLPYETLIVDGGGDAKYLLERFAVAYAPSASALAAVSAPSARPQSHGLLAFGDPAYSDPEVELERSAETGPEAPAVRYYAERGFDFRQLPYTRTEVNDIAALFSGAGPRVFLGADATEKNLKGERLERYRYLHFATHGVADEENPARSGVILSLRGDEGEDGVLQVTEIMRLRINADLVTLSACRTGLGRVVGGEGVLGLTRAFLYAGARGVAASLWNVNDTATAGLMKSFYANLKKGQPKDEALRRAKLSMLHGRQRTWRHPYYWAPFVLVGAND